eukprot:scpid76952/ scgid9788/ Coiled-coil domain-containing protein 94
MAERKVYNKYFPPDFDPTKLPKLKLEKDRQYVIRIMAPFNMRCNNCGEYIHKGKKFNSRKETVQGETYLGLYKFRFYIRCPTCISELTFKTDPENTDYEMEKGGTRCFQAHKLAMQEEKRLEKEREEEEASNPMKALEKRTEESKAEMDVLDALEDIKDQNARIAQVDMVTLLQSYKRMEEEDAVTQERRDEEEVNRLFGATRGVSRRLDEEDEVEHDEAIRSKISDSFAPPPLKKKKTFGGLELVKKKQLATTPAAAAVAAKSNTLTTLAAYSSSDSE